MRDCIIVDLDETLLDSREIKHLEPKDKDRRAWDKFHRHFDKCKVNKWCLEIIRRFSDHKILFVTAREAKGICITTTEKMVSEALNSLDIKNPVDYEIFMRNENDYRPSCEVKRDIYTMCIKGRYNILFAIDDDIRNIEMLKSLGITTLQCRYGD